MFIVKFKSPSLLMYIWSIC